MTKCVGFDIEIGNQLENFSEWPDHRPLSLTCIGFAPLNTEEVQLDSTSPIGMSEAPYAMFGEDPLGRPLDEMSRADAYWVVIRLERLVAEGYTIVTWNGLAFDFVALADASGLYKTCKALAFNHVDFLFNFYMQLAYRVSLNTTAKETLGIEKSAGMSGAEAPAMWHKGPSERALVIEYVKQDALTVAQLFAHWQDNDAPLVKWRSKSGLGTMRRIVGNHKWHPCWTVNQTLENVEPPAIPPWMKKNPVTLGSFLKDWRR